MSTNDLARVFIAAAIALLLTSGFIAALVSEIDQPPVNAGAHSGTMHSRAAQPAPLAASHG